MKKQTNPAHQRAGSVDHPVRSELSTVPAVGEVISVRAAKTHLSALLDFVAAGHEVVIASAGQPKVRLVSYAVKPGRKAFGGAARHLAQMPGPAPGPSAEELIRADRDGRGW